MNRNGSPRGTLDPFGTIEFPGDTLPDPRFGVPVAQPARRGPEEHARHVVDPVRVRVRAGRRGDMAHLALSQIKHLHQRGRDRALVGLTLSNWFIWSMIVALVVWASAHRRR